MLIFELKRTGQIIIEEGELGDGVEINY